VLLLDLAFKQLNRDRNSRLKKLNECLS
jgi:hypothetical protein